MKNDSTELKSPIRSYRQLCLQCLQPEATCYCAHIRKFDPKMEFVILIHPLECRRRIATGRMSHLCLEKSYLIRGHDYSKNELVNDLLADPSREPVMLYPGVQSKNLTHCTADERATLFASDKILTVFVIDGTWATAKKMVKHSQNIKNLPRICFTPPGPSNFRVRKQPREGCYSTIEAIHHTIELLGSARGFDLQSRLHDGLLDTFSVMVEQQLEFIKKSRERLGPSRYRQNIAV